MTQTNTDEQKIKTVGDIIDEEFNKQMSLYKTLKECGNPKPALVTVSEWWLNHQFIADKVREMLEEALKEELEQDEHKTKLRTRTGTYAITTD